MRMNTTREWERHGLRERNVRRSLSHHSATGLGLFKKKKGKENSGNTDGVERWHLSGTACLGATGTTWQHTAQGMPAGEAAS